MPLLWAVLGIVGAALVVFLLLWAILRRRKKAPPAEEVKEVSETVAEAAAETPATPVRVEQVDVIDALAAEGRFEEAMALLLVRSLHHVGWRPEGQGRSVTAREVLYGLDAVDPRREPLSEVVVLGELVRFAGAGATRERFESMRQGYSRLTQLPSPEAAGAPT